MKDTLETLGDSEEKRPGIRAGILNLEYLAIHGEDMPKELVDEIVENLRRWPQRKTEEKKLGS
jgi:hypothetical protein